MNTNELIANLSAQAPSKTLGTPRYYALRLGAVLAAYATGAQIFLGLRLDLAVQFTRPMFAIEVVLLALLAVASAGAAILSMYPDAYQKKSLLKLPYGIFAALAAFILFQLSMPHDPMMAMPELGAHGMECALCIASVAIVPSALIFGLLRKGASVHPLRSGSFAVLAASGIGCITLRLAEVNDSLMHLVGWHYLPTLLFAALGAIIGKHLLKW